MRTLIVAGRQRKCFFNETIVDNSKRSLLRVAMGDMMDVYRGISHS